MILYINGDSNAAGAEAANGCAFAEDDGRYWELGRKPHPDNEAVCWGTVLANSLGWDRYNDSESAASNDRILRTTQEYLKHNRPDAVVIGWTTWEREEWWYKDCYYQVNASGRDQVHPDLRERYQEWVLEQDEAAWIKKEVYWHEKIWDLHLSLEKLDVPHIFFNCYCNFNYISFKDDLAHLQQDWNGSFIGPYDKTKTYYELLVSMGHQTVSPGSYHFGIEAHAAWANWLGPQLTRLL